jgi:hypothetical protein
LRGTVDYEPARSPKHKNAAVAIPNDLLECPRGCGRRHVALAWLRSVDEMAIVIARL